MSSVPNYQIDNLLHDVTVCTSVVMRLMKGLMSILISRILPLLPRKTLVILTPLDAGQEATFTGLYIVGSMIEISDTR